MTAPSPRAFAHLPEALRALFELPESPEYRTGRAAVLRLDQARRLLGLVCWGKGETPPCRFLINDVQAAPRHSRSFSVLLADEGLMVIHILWFALDDAFRSFSLRAEDGRDLPLLLAGRALRVLDPAILRKLPLPLSRPLWLAFLSRLCRLAGLPRLLRLCGRSRYGDCWLFADRGFMADDNAEHLYRWVQRQHPEQRIFFALHKNSPDWPRLQREGFNLVHIAGPSYLAACCNCSWLISSQRADYIAKHYWRRWHPEVFRYRFCFLQHGITMNYLPRLNNPHADIMVSSTLREYEALSRDPRFAYVYSTRETRLTGQPRHDELLRKAAARPEPKTVLIMPTWRHGQASGQSRDGQFLYGQGFTDSEYYRRWQAVLESPQLTQAVSKGGYRLLFYPHPHLRPMLRHFRLGHAVLAEEHERIQDVLADTALLITDYSSIAMETALLRRPVLYYQFDRDAFFNDSHGHGRGKGYFDYLQDGFGEVVTDEEQLLRLATEHMRQGCRMKEEFMRRAAAFFPYSDQEHCRRVYDALCESGA